MEIKKLGIIPKNRIEEMSKELKELKDKVDRIEKSQPYYPPQPYYPYYPYYYSPCNQCWHKNCWNCPYQYQPSPHYGVPTTTGGEY